MGQLESNVKEAYGLYHKSNKGHLLTKFVILISELFDVLDRTETSASYLLRIANVIQGAPLIVALFFEQAALKFLKLKQYRKFGFYMMQAALNFSSLGMNEYALNNFQCIHSFYQANQGWQHIQFTLYSNLGAKVQSFKNQEVANNFFKNYLRLCSDIKDPLLQKKYISTCKQSVQSWLRRKLEIKDAAPDVNEANGILEVGELAIPQISDDHDVFIDSERIFSNQEGSLIDKKFMRMP
mmetsp:Transcript_3545/g.6037  ORF Transcript_3545/g.6037 Transcript_3545/m.6037 type:complete len:239 (+) Transcript_3545:37-753(+)